jgi:hypothetical protein
MLRLVARCVVWKVWRQLHEGRILRLSLSPYLGWLELYADIVTPLSSPLDRIVRVEHHLQTDGSSIPLHKFCLYIRVKFHDMSGH